jgi:CheY-like chemotaxis protein
MAQAELPLDAQLAAVQARLPAVGVERPRVARSRRRVMVVEDDSDQRQMLAEVLAELGCDVEPASSGDVAMARLEAGLAIDVLISDQRMPGMSGIELARALAERHPQVRAILLTAFGDEQTCQQALQARAVTVLAKPVRVVDLARVLDEANA